MEDNLPDDWYALLVEQSKTDHIYTLIHEGLSHDFEPEDPEGIVVIHPDDLPATLQPMKLNHLAKNADDFAEGGLVLLKNKYLQDYLEAGVSFEIYYGEEYDYALLNFHKELPAADDFISDIRDNHGKIIDLNKPESVFDDDDPLLLCWVLVSRGENLRLALQMAEEGERILDAKMPHLLQDDLAGFLRVSSGYNIIAVVYAWNNEFEKAAILDTHYILKPWLWPLMKTVIEPYLEMLIAKKQTPYLNYLFEHLNFRAFFLPHYEAFISLRINPHYKCSRMREMVPIINRVNNGVSKYL